MKKSLIVFKYEHKNFGTPPIKRWDVCPLDASDVVPVSGPWALRNRQLPFLGSTVTPKILLPHCEEAQATPGRGRHLTSRWLRIWKANPSAPFEHPQLIPRGAKMSCLHYSNWRFVSKTVIVTKYTTFWEDCSAAVDNHSTAAYNCVIHKGNNVLGVMHIHMLASSKFFLIKEDILNINTLKHLKYHNSSPYETFTID